MNLLIELLRDMALASVPAVGFALVFHVPARVLKYCALGGALGHGLRFLLLKTDMPIEWATLIAAGVVSFWGVWCAQRLRAHPKVFTVASMIPMIPGVPFFTALLALIEIQHRGYSPELLATAVGSGIKTLFIVTSLAVGLALPGLLLYRRTPVV
jgi:uncharacterized membrane protein YjjB (DUF3815 family)